MSDADFSNMPYDPAAELEKTKGLLKITPQNPAGTIAGAAQAKGPGAEPLVGNEIDGFELRGFELRGKEKVVVTFDPSIHKANPDGSPVLGSKKQFMLKKEAKKSAKQVLSDGVEKVKNVFSSGNKQISGENSEEPEIPLSDHELQEKEEKAAKARAIISELNDELTASSESSAELFFFGGSMVLGLSFANQRDKYFDRVAGHFRRYEEKTGKSVDLPPSMALVMGLGQVAFAISQKEPECKTRLDSGVSVLRKNVGAFLGDKVPFFAAPKKQNEGAE